MANAPRQSAPAQKPAQPMPNPAEGFDVLRPFRMFGHFVTGSLGGMLNGMSRWGSRGFTVGAIGGVLLGLAAVGTTLSPIGVALLATLGGTAAGIALGGVLGLVTGGLGQAGRSQAAEDRASRARQPRQVDWGAREQHIDRVNDSNVERILQQNQENERNQNTYWQDRVSQDIGGHNRGF